MTDQELKDLVASLAVAQAQTTKDIQMLSLDFKAHQTQANAEMTAIREAQKQTNEQLRKTDEQLQALAKQTKHIDGTYGRKFGTFIESILYDSLEDMLKENFDVQGVGRIKMEQGAETCEIDLLAYSNTNNKAFIVEIKNVLRPDGIKQILRQLKDFPVFFPEHKEKHLFGVLAATSASERMKEEAKKTGLYVVSMSKDLLAFEDFDGYAPRDFRST